MGEDRQPSRAGRGSGVTPFQNGLAGATAGVVSRFVIAPLDVVKIRFQMQTTSRKLFQGQGVAMSEPPPKYTGIMQAARLIVKEEGLRGLWKGNLSAEYLYLAYGAVQFFIYAEMGRIIDSIYKGFFDAFRTIYAKEGLGGFYRGVWPSVFQIMPYMGIMFESQRIFKESLQRLKGSRYLPKMATEDFVSGGLAGIVSKTAVMPFDVVRKRLQVQGPDRNSYVMEGIPRYRGILTCATQIVRHEGIGALYKGLLPSILKSGPSSAVTFLIVGEMRRYFGEANRRAGR
ncbi:mitochondrial thiamine pyrophosphate transporter [Irineochytrium annulatum]|nr:mitochondrial thiamine pyrophosphate transporter [Irineochytrium annulatum]